MHTKGEEDALRNEQEARDEKAKTFASPKLGFERSFKLLKSEKERFYVIGKIFS